MPLLTGTPEGQINEQDELFLEGAPYIYYQDNRADPLNNPDADNYYWGMSGTVTYPAFALACYEDVSLADDVTVNAVRCDQIGDRAVIQKRNHLVFSFSLSSLFPLANIGPIMRAGTAVQTTAPLEKMGIGDIDTSIYYRIYLPKVYDNTALDWVSITIHRAQFVDPWTIAMVSGDKWMLGGISAWALATTDTQAGQEFATIIRHDPSLIT